MKVQYLDCGDCNCIWSSFEKAKAYLMELAERWGWNIFNIEEFEDGTFTCKIEADYAVFPAGIIPYDVDSGE